jgi:metal-sulfur cluster biosynthetic enzyme
MTAPEIASALRDAYDPELGIDVVALGLVYGITPESDGFVVTMTLTSPGCPLGAVIIESAEAVLRNRFPGDPVTVETTFDPPWSVDMADDLARAQLGLPPSRS